MGTNEHAASNLTFANDEQILSYDKDRICSLVRAAFGVSEMLLEMAEACEVTDYARACAYEMMYDTLYNASEPFLSRNSFGRITGIELES